MCSMLLDTLDVAPVYVSLRCKFRGKLKRLFLPRIYVEKGQESKGVQELSSSLQTLASTYDGMKIVVKLVIQHDALPDLSQVMMLLRGMRGLIRYIVIDLERSPAAIMSQLSG